MGKTEAGTAKLLRGMSSITEKEQQRNVTTVELSCRWKHKLQVCIRIGIEQPERVRVFRVLAVDCAKRKK